MKNARKTIAVLVTVFSLMATLAVALSVDGITPINDRDYPPAVRKLIDGANSNIKLMLYQARFYDDYPDTMSNKFLESLLAALKRGVDVTVIIDISEWNAENIDFNVAFADKLIEAGAVVYKDDPQIVSHQKVMLFDDVISVVGSFNWSFYSLDKNHEVATILWSADVNEHYTDYFNKRMSEATRYLPKKPVPNIEKAREAGFTVLPAINVETANNRNYYPRVHEVITQAKSKVWVAQMSAMYYMTRPSQVTKSPVGDAPSQTNLLLKDLVAAKKRGLDVKVVLDVSAERDNINVDFANRLLAADIEVYWDDPQATTHAKMLVIDDDISVIGSTNWSLNALEIGNEASVIIESKEINKVYSDYIQNLIEGGTKVTTCSEFSEPGDPVLDPEKSQAEVD